MFLVPYLLYMKKILDSYIKSRNPSDIFDQATLDGILEHYKHAPLTCNFASYTCFPFVF